MYDVCLSFAGEDRELVEAVAEKLKSYKIKVFYDNYEKEVLWGKDLTQYLYDIYKNQSRYCVVFVSKDYKKKNWTQHEFRSALNRAFIEREEYILPVQIDNTELDGLPTTTGYISIKDYSAVEIAELISKKLNQRATLFSNCRSISAALSKALDYLIPIADSQYIQIMLIASNSEYTNGLYVVADYAENRYIEWGFASFDGLIGKCYETGEVVLCNDIKDDTRYIMAFEETKSELVIPITNRSNKLIGVVNFESRKNNTYEKEMIGKSQRMLVDLADYLMNNEFYKLQARDYKVIRRFKNTN